MIGFTGPYSDVNFGDYAMLVNNVYTLDPSEVTIFVYDRSFMETVSDRYFADRRVTLAEVKFRPGAFSGSRDTGVMTPIEILREIENIEEVQATIESVDTLYVNGGGYLNSLWMRPHRIERLMQILAPALVAVSMGKQVVFTANGYGPFRGDTEFFASLFGSLSSARFAVRDTILSPHWMMQAGVAPERLQVLPDDLLFIDERLSESAHAPVRDPYVVVETYLSTDFVAANIAKFEEFARVLWELHGLRVLFMPFNLGHGGVDQGHLLSESISGLELFDIEKMGYLPIEDAVALVRNAELVISSRYHAVILALGVGTPFVSVLKDVLGDKQYYYGKNVGALEGVLQDEAHDLRDYFFMDYLEALDAVAHDFVGITRRQRRAHSAAFPTTSKKLLAARDSYLKGGN